MLAVGALAGALLTGCTGTSQEPAASPSGSASGSSSSGGSASGSASPTTRPVVPPAPEADACYRLAVPQLTRPTSDADPVRCRSRHTARTIFVGRLRTVVDGHSVAVDSAAVQRQLATTCPRRLAAFVGGSAQTRDLSRFNVVWFSPTLAQSDAGADWFRCDLVAFADEESLLALPRRGSLRGVLDRPDALDTYGLCGSAAPGTAGFERLACGRSHSWRAFATIPLSGGRRYPGVAAVRSAGDSTCKDRARARSQDSLRFRYGWEWPTRDQWQRGQRYGLCWVPD